jgi:hypothetical protein
MRYISRVLPAIALAVGTWVFTPPEASAVLIDGFGDDLPTTLVATLPDGVVDNLPGQSITDTGLTNTTVTRVIEVETTVANTNAKRTSVSVAGGEYSHVQDSQTKGRSKITYTFSGPATVDLSSGVAIRIQVNFADLPGGKIDITLIDSSSNTSTQSVAIPVVGGTDPPVIVSQLLSDFDPPVSLGTVKNIMVEIDGTAVEGLDVDIDFIETPEPATLGVLGIGLLGLGFMARRRNRVG